MAAVANQPMSNSERFPWGSVSFPTGAPQPERVPPTTFAPLEGRFAWKGAELTQSPFWGLVLSPEELADLEAALDYCKPQMQMYEGMPLNMSKDKFPLPVLGPRITAMADELEHGVGAVMISNFPVENHSEEDIAVLYLGVCSHIGCPVPQSSAGLRSVSRGYGLPLGRVQAEMSGKTPVQGKQSNNYFRLHTDRTDVITLLSIRKASKGGCSRVTSAVSVYNELLKSHPHLVPLLFNNVDRIWEGENGFYSYPPWAITDEGKFTTQIAPSYVENAQATGLCSRPLSEDELEAIDLLEEIGLQTCYDFMMQPGNVYWLNNHVVYHGRDGWTDKAAAAGENQENSAPNVDEAASDSEVGGKGRLLFRVWLSPYNSRPLPDTATFRRLWGNTAGGAVRGGLEPAVATGEYSVDLLRQKLGDAIAKGHAYYGLFKRKYGIQYDEEPAALKFEE
jgi:hypothetical protein